MVRSDQHDQFRELRTSFECPLCRRDVSEDGRFLYTITTWPNSIYRWDLKAGGNALRGGEGYSGLEPGKLIAIFYRRRDDSIFTFGQDGRLCWSDLAHSRLKDAVQPAFSRAGLPEFAGHPIKVPELFDQAFFFANGNRMAVRSGMGGLHVIEVDTGKELYVVPEAKQFVLSPDENTMAAVWGSGDRLITKLGTLHHLDVSREDGSIMLLDSATGKQKRRIDLPGTEAWALAFSPDGKTLAAANGWEQGRIHLFEVATGKETRTITTPPLRSPALAFTPDGKKIMSAMADTSVLVWDLAAEPN